MDAYWPMLKNALEMFVFLGAELSILFILISGGISLIQQYIPESKIQALLGGAHGKGYLMAAIIGAVTPFCSCSTIPMLRGLLKAKAGFGPTMTFLFSSPLLNPIIIGLFFVTFGGKVTLAYAAIAMVVSVAAGIILGSLHYEKYVIPENNNIGVSKTPKTGCCSIPANDSACCLSSKLIPLQPLNIIYAQQTATPCCSTTEAKEANTTSCCDAVGSPESATFTQKLQIAFKEGWRQFLQVSLYLLLGVSLGAFIYGFVPSEFIAKYASGDSKFAVPIAAVIGIPLYVRVEALIPLTAVLVGKGMGLGAVMALIIGGGGASITEVILLKSMFRTPMIIAFLAVILGMAIMAGYFFQFIL